MSGRQVISAQSGAAQYGSWEISKIVSHAACDRGRVESSDTSENRSDTLLKIGGIS